MIRTRYAFPMVLSEACKKTDSGTGCGRVHNDRESRNYTVLRRADLTILTHPRLDTIEPKFKRKFCLWGVYLGMLDESTLADDGNGLFNVMNSMSKRGT
jgi:hypothetical protein